jgi:gamma-glutamyl phosphate reductase
VNKEQQDYLVECLIDDAGYGIGYWAKVGEVDDTAKTYRVVVCDEYATDVAVVEKTLTYANIKTAIRKIADGRVSLNEYHTKFCKDFVFDPDNADYDAETADCVIQVAMFDDVVFA